LYADILPTLQTDITRTRHYSLSTLLLTMAPPSLRPSSSKVTKQERIIWAPPIPSINWTELHETISLCGILTQAAQLREGKGCAFIFGSNTEPFSGSQCIIFAVNYADSTKYAFRLPYHLRKPKIRDILFSNELEHWEAFIQSCIPLVPRVFGYSMTTDNPIGFPFIAYEWVEGRPLDWNDYEPQNTIHRERIIRTLAHFTVDTACKLNKPGRYLSSLLFVHDQLTRNRRHNC
jgi:hypothetical protein